jgi:hypothetical protein
MEFVFYSSIILSLMFVFMLGALFGWTRHQNFLDRTMHKMIREVTTEIRKNSIEITIEKHGAMIYIYDKNTKQFMAQGSSRDEVEEILLKKFPGKKFVADQKEIDEGFSDAKSL